MANWEVLQRLHPCAVRVIDLVPRVTTAVKSTDFPKSNVQGASAGKNRGAALSASWPGRRIDRLTRASNLIGVKGLVK